VTKLLEQAFEAARSLPPAMQDEMARVIMAMTGEELPVVQLTPEEEASFEQSLAQAERGEFATDDQVRAIWTKHGL
jgi:predicted transcriptional regulator